MGQSTWYGYPPPLPESCQTGHALFVLDVVSSGITGHLTLDCHLNAYVEARGGIDETCFPYYPYATIQGYRGTCGAIIKSNSRLIFDGTGNVQIRVNTGQYYHPHYHYFSPGTYDLSSYVGEVWYDVAIIFPPYHRVQLAIPAGIRQVLDDTYTEDFHVGAIKILNLEENR